jgi:hypothetical protein
MTNTKKPASPQRRTIRDRQAEAEKNLEPYRMYVDDETVIEIARPTGGVLFDIEEAMYAEGTTSTTIIGLMCGDRADAVLEVFRGIDHEIVSEELEAIAEHFGLGKLIGSPTS